VAFKYLRRRDVRNPSKELATRASATADVEPLRQHIPLESLITHLRIISISSLPNFRGWRLAHDKCTVGVRSKLASLNPRVVFKAIKGLLISVLVFSTNVHHLPVFLSFFRLRSSRASEDLVSPANARSHFFVVGFGVTVRVKVGLWVGCAHVQFHLIGREWNPTHQRGKQRTTIPNCIPLSLVGDDIDLDTGRLRV
jgi:hypothetical protein